MMPRITATLAEHTAQIMTLLHPGWQMPGAKALLREAADLAPADELIRAAIAYSVAPGVKAPSLEVFRDPSGAWWHAGMPEHARTVRPSELPTCATHPWVTLSALGHCGACRSEQIATEAPQATPSADPQQVAVNAAGRERVQQAIDEARRTA